MLKDRLPVFAQLEQDVNEVYLRNRREPERAKQLAALTVMKFLDEHAIKVDDAIERLEDAAQEEQDFSVFGIVEILREYSECSNSQ